MDLRKIRKLIEIFNASKLGEIEIREGEESIRLTKAVQPVAAHPQHMIVAEPQTLPMPSPELEEIEIDTDLSDGTSEIKSPMVGTFFAAAAPGDPPFVSEGDFVEVGQPICLIEAMKIFNQIEAEQSGTIVKVLKQDREPVEYGEPIFLIRE